MEMYLNYSEYKNFGGTLEEPTFNSLIYEAQLKLDYHTFNRLVDDTIFSDKVKICLTKIITLLNSYNEYDKVVSDINNPVIASQSNDGVSISYGGYLGSTTPNDINTLKDRLENDIKLVIHQYLYGERNQKNEVLLYRGVYK